MTREHEVEQHEEVKEQEREIEQHEEEAPGGSASGTVTLMGRQIQLLASEGLVITVRSWLSLTSKFILHFNFFIVFSLHGNFALTYEYNIFF
jgi:hypothetical protein